MFAFNIIPQRHDFVKKGWDVVTLEMSRAVKGSSTCCCHLNFLQPGGFISRLYSHASLLTPFLFFPSHYSYCELQLPSIGPVCRPKGPRTFAPCMHHAKSSVCRKGQGKWTTLEMNSLALYLQGELSGSDLKLLEDGCRMNYSHLCPPSGEKDNIVVLCHTWHACLSVFCIPRFLLFI